MAGFDADEARRLEEEARKQQRLWEEERQRERQESDSQAKAESLKWWRERGLEELCAEVARKAQQGHKELFVDSSGSESRCYNALEREEARRDVVARGFKLKHSLGGFWGPDRWTVSWDKSPVTCCCVPGCGAIVVDGSIGYDRAKDRLEL